MAEKYGEGEIQNVLFAIVWIMLSFPMLNVRYFGIKQKETREANGAIFPC